MFYFRSWLSTSVFHPCTIWTQIKSVSLTTTVHYFRGYILNNITFSWKSNFWLDFVFQKNERFSIAKENNKTFSVNILNILIKNEQINYKYRYFSTISTKNLSKKLICHQENRYNLKTIIFVHSLQTCIHFISPLLLDLM